MPKSRNLQKTDEAKKIFVAEYLVSLNATAAYKAAHPDCTDATARTEGSKLLAKPDVQDAIAASQSARAKRVELSADEVLTELKRLAFFDPRKLFSATGMPIDIHELDDDTARAIAGLEVVEVWEGTGENRKFVGFTKKYKLVDKVSALGKAMLHLGLMKPKEVKHEGDIKITIVDYRAKKENPKGKK